MAPMNPEIIVYGSLLHPSELAKRGFDPERARPVKVEGYTRVFCQAPTWRKAPETACAVLTVLPSASGWLNGLLIPLPTGQRLAELENWESGYDRVEVPHHQIHSYDLRPVPDAPSRSLFRGKPEKRNDTLQPNAYYATLCINGASHWGSQFQADFIDSTRLGSGEPLRGYIDSGLSLRARPPHAEHRPLGEESHLHSPSPLKMRGPRPEQTPLAGTKLGRVGNTPCMCCTPGRRSRERS